MSDTIRKAIDRARKRERVPSGTEIVVCECACGYVVWRWCNDPALSPFAKNDCPFCKKSLKIRPRH